LVFAAGGGQEKEGGHQVRDCGERQERRSSELRFKLNILAVSFCEILCFPIFTFSLKPKLFIPSGWPATFFPDFPRAMSDFSFLRLRHSAGSLFQFVSQGQYAADRFLIADPLRELAVFVGLREKIADELLLIHGALHLKYDHGAARLFNF
jgi:hypothetical protein